jgi:CRISPR-associated endonuclease/helicase Cas3
VVIPPVATPVAAAPTKWAQPIAHLHDDKHHTHDLAEHLRSVGRGAGRNCAKFDSETAGVISGYWHDIGKYRDAFQIKLDMASQGLPPHEDEDDKHKHVVDHSSVGAAMAWEKGYHPIALVIAAHHGGLHNLSDWKDRRYPEKKGLLQEIQNKQIPADILNPKPLEQPKFLKFQSSARSRLTAGVGAVHGAVSTRLRSDRTAYLKKVATDPSALMRRGELWTRMVFSSLVDADWLDAEKFFSDMQKPKNRAGFASLIELTSTLRKYLAGISTSGMSAGVLGVRRNLLGDCRSAANWPQGVYSVTAPTGAGKTLSSLEFALNHAIEHGRDRVIYVAPYLSIIDQTATEYRKALAGASTNELFIEHHTALDPKKETERNRLATENWAAPLIVTTAVQFFESLFSNRTSKCRKLHNITRSVVIIDEVQTLPSELLVPIIEVLQDLVDHYGVTLVLVAASQPVLVTRKHADGRKVFGFRSVTEINSRLHDSFNKLRRVRVENIGKMGYEDMAKLVAAEPRALAITHLRDDARLLAIEVNGILGANDRCIHLSALMCAAHRMERVAEIKARLREKNGPVHVVATQLIEAGVDIDFPRVFRAIAGFDTLINAAGRCNRHGDLPNGSLGTFTIFDPPTQPPIGDLRRGAALARAILANNPNTDLFNPSVYQDFDRRMDRVRDSRGIQNHREKMEFDEVAKKFQMIDDSWQTPVIVPWGPTDDRRYSMTLADRIEHCADIREMRRLKREVQRYVVTIPTKLALAWVQDGVMRSLDGGSVLAPNIQYEAMYDEEFGLLPMAELLRDEELSG